MTTSILLEGTNNQEEELVCQLLANPEAKRIKIGFRDPACEKFLLLSPLRGREFDLLDLRGVKYFDGLSHVLTKKLMVTIDHLMNGSMFIVTGYLKWEGNFPFNPDLIEVHVESRRVGDFDTTTGAQLDSDEEGSILTLQEELREINPKGVIMVIWK